MCDGQTPRTHANDYTHPFPVNDEPIVAFLGAVVVIHEVLEPTMYYTYITHITTTKDKKTMHTGCR